MAHPISQFIQMETNMFRKSYHLRAGGALLIWAAEEGLGPKPRLRSSPSFLVPTAVPIFGWVRGNWVHFGTTPDLSASRLGQSPPARSGDGARG